MTSKPHERSPLFNEDYYLNGKLTGVSNYENYRWLPEVTLPCVHRMMQYLGASTGELVCDWGCGPGMYVKALRMMGFEGYGYDISEWAVENCHPDVKQWVSTSIPTYFPDWCILKDSAEHIPEPELAATFTRLNTKTLKGLLIIVPLTREVDGPYVRTEDEMDKTHLIRWPMAAWMQFLEQHFPRFTLSASYHIPGIKPASKEVPHSTAFFKLTK